MATVSPLKLTDFSKFYGQARGVTDLNLELHHGEVFGFLGPNGAGKTTTIRTILNFIAPTKGKIRVYGLDSVDDQIEIKRKIGYLAGDIALYDNMTGEDLLKYLTSLGRQTDWDYVHDLAGRFDANLKRPIRTLSKGNKQKIGLIQACMYHPDLLILDEPTSGLDPLMQNVFYDLILEFKKNDKTVFLSSHNLSEVQKICDRAGFIRNGKLVSVEPIAKVSDDTTQIFQAVFRKPLPKDAFSKLKEVQVETNDNRATFTITGNLQPFLKELSNYDIVMLDRQEVTLEEVFMKYYRGEDNA